MSSSNIISADTACKDFFNFNPHFSSFFNAVLFQGQDIIQSHQLSSWQSEETAIVDKEGEPIDMKRFRDTIKKADMNGCYSIIGIESQKSIDYSMVLRVPIYDLLNYYNQYKNMEGSDSKKRVLPVTTIVFYVGEKRWQGAKTLKGIMKEIPQELEKYINDWKLIFIDIKEIETEKIKDKETREMIETVKKIYGLKRGRKLEEGVISKEAAITAGAITGTNWLIEEAMKKKDKEEISMCEAMENYTKEVFEDGQMQGKTKVIIQQLTKKLGQLSEMMIKKIEASTIETIDILSISIFDIESEDDILKIIH